LVQNLFEKKIIFVMGVKGLKKPGGGGGGGVKNLWQIELSELRCSWVRTSKKICEENVAQQNTDFAFRDDCVHTREHRSCGEGA